MTDKEKIRAEIEKRYRENKADGYSDVCEELWDILSFIDSMQEEPVSGCLEKAAKNVGQKYFPDEDNIWARPNYEAVKVERAFKAGAKWQKEQMMTKAIDVEVKVDAGGYPYIDRTIELYDYDKDAPLAKAGDMYKVILIKEY